MDSSVVIDGHSVVFSQCLLLEDKKIAVVSFWVEDWLCKLGFSFEPDESNQQDVKVTVETDRLHFKFGWTNGIGTAFTAPYEFAKSPSGRKLILLVYHHKIGPTNRLDVQVVLGAQA